MTHISDEQLSAYMDGELPAAGMDAVHRELKRSASLQQRLQQLQQADQAARRFFDQLGSQPLPDGLEALILNHQPEDDDSKVHRLASRRRPFYAGWGIAASVALASVLYWQWPASAPAVNAAYQHALSSLSSGSVEPINEHTRLELRWSEVRQGDFCRHYMVHTPQQSVVADACWRDGAWQLDSTDGPGDQYQPASADNSMPVSALTAKEEAAWLSRLPAL